MKDTTNIMDVASVDVTESQAEALTNISAAKEIDLGAITGGVSDIPTIRMRKTRPVVRDYKIRRNEQCPCGSGKKYKHCCLASGKYETTHTI